MATVAFTTRTFHYNGIEIADPNPSLPIRECQDLLSAQYPELANAKAHSETQPDGSTFIRFTVAAGTKG